MTLPTFTTSIDEESQTQEREREDAAAEEHFRHLICFLCYPDFATVRRAPHDAECICGKPVRRGDGSGPPNAPNCVLCDEMAGPHYRSKHGGRRPL